VEDRKEPHLDTVGALLNESCFHCNPERIVSDDIINTAGMRPAFFVHEPGSHNFLLSSSFTCNHGDATA